MAAFPFGFSVLSMVNGASHSLVVFRLRYGGLRHERRLTQLEVEVAIALICCTGCAALRQCTLFKHHG